MRPQKPHQFLFYTANLTTNAESVDLSGSEHQHLSRVLRMREGETVFATNGKGLLAECAITRILERSSELQVVRVTSSVAERREVALALACLKKEAFEKAVKQCTELGMTQCIPFSSVRGHVGKYGSGFIDRLDRIALSSMKQSFRSIRPKILQPVPFMRLLELSRNYDRVVVGNMGSDPISIAGERGSVLIVVGPEAGFAREEKEHLLEIGGELAGASEHRLRSETAAVALLALLLASQ